MKKWIGLLLLMLGLVTLSGCSFGNIETDKLIHPPKPTGEMAEIVKAIEEVSGSNITFKYPQNGEYRSAVIMQDVDGDGEDEAIAIYQMDDDESVTHVAIIDRQNGRYVNVGFFRYQASEVDKICFGDVNGDGKKEIFLGWSSYDNSGKKIAMCYSHSGYYYTQVLKDMNYSDFIIADFDGDNLDELLVLTLSRTDSNAESEAKTSDKEANAKLIKLEKDELADPIEYKFNTMGKALMDSTSLKYVNTLFGNINSEQKGVVADSMVSGNVITTEIVYWDAQNKKLVTPLYQAQTHTSPFFKREVLILSSDVNDDGIIEIPSIDSYQYMSYKNDAYIMSWVVYSTKDNQITTVKEYINNDTDAYIMGIADKWIDSKTQDYKILVKYDGNSKTMTVSEKIMSGQNIMAGSDLLSIEVIGSSDWENITDKSNMKELARVSDQVYVAKVLNPDNPLSISLSEIDEMFSVK